MRLSRRYIPVALALGLASLSISSPLAQEDESAGLQRFSNAGPHLQAILSRGTLRVGLQRDYRPFHIAQPNEGYPGIDVDVANALAQFLGVAVEFQYGGVSDLIAMAAGGSVDIALGGISSGLDRAPYVLFSDPYITTTPAALLARRVLPPESQADDFPRRRYTNLGDLRLFGRMTIGVKAGTTNEAILRTSSAFERHEIKTFDTNGAIVAALRDGDVDALVADGVFIRAAVLQDGGLLSRFLPLVESYREEHLCVVTARGDRDFQDLINFFIKEMQRTGRLDRLRQNYLEKSEWVQ